MKFTPEINKLVIGLLILFGIVASAAAYWSVVGPDTIAQRQDNPRLVEVEARIRRGDIQDRDGELLVTSLQNSDGSVTRQYLHQATYSALGYASLRYGVSGAEAAYNTSLRGDDLGRDFVTQLTDDVLHRTQQGSDIRLTFDLTIQQAALAAMNEGQGAVVALAVPSGQVLAMVSLPTYDPNMLDENWETLTKAPGNPFFNRVLQGAYQPGGVLQTPLLGTALLANYSLDDTTEQATQAVQVGKVEFQCIEQPAQNTLTLAEAYAYGCPYPFLKLIQTLGVGTVESAFDTFQIDEPPTLPGYVLLPPDQPTPTAAPFQLGNGDYAENALGQGEITVSPLEMAVITAAIFNDGDAPMPYTLLQIRQPNSTEWADAAPSYSAIPMMTANSAHQLQDVMRLAVTAGAAEHATRGGLTDIGGHVAVAYAGESSQVWFIGFAGLEAGGGIAIAIVLEDSDDTGLVAEMGGEILARAIEQLQEISPQTTGGA